MADLDIQIKGGTIVDGTRVPRYRGDVWIKDGKVAQIGGRAPGFAKKVIDASGLIVAPGFVDLHTHYDAQMNWDWETIPQYMDSLDRSPKGINCIQYMPTASLMTYVMGLEAAKTRPATAAERVEMARLLDEGMDAGLCGFSIQRLGVNSAQADFDGSPMVTDTMCDEDILNLARVLRNRDEGFMEITQATDPADNRADLAFVKKLAGVAMRPILFQAIAPTRKNAEIHRRLLRWIEECR